MDEDGNVVRNKVRLVEKGYYQLDGIDYTETYASVARLKGIRILISFAAVGKVKLCQMDVESVFLNGEIKQEVYVEQPPNFESSTNPKHVFKLNKVFYGLK